MREYNKTLPEEAYLYAQKELQETDRIRQDSLILINQWLDENPTIPAIRSPINLLYFLRSTKFNLDETKEKITNFYKMKVARTEWYENRDPFDPKMVELLDIGVFLPLKIKDEHNRQVIIIRTAAHNPKLHDQNDVFKIGKMILDYLMSQDESISIYGIIAIFDMTGVTLGHALQLPPQLIKRSVQSWEYYPCLTKKLEFVHAPLHVNAVMSTFRLFMTSKLRARVFVTGRGPTVTANLPPELGGKGDDFKTLALYWKETLQTNKDWFNKN